MVAFTTVQITNVTGKKATFTGTYHDYYGHLKPGSSYPTEIENGETVYFVFENQDDDQSSGAVVYRGDNGKGSKFDWLYAWYNDKEGSALHAYTEIAEENHTWDWHQVYANLMKSGSGSQAECANCRSKAVISKPPCPVIYQGVMSLGT